MIKICQFIFIYLNNPQKKGRKKLKRGVLYSKKKAYIVIKLT